MTRGAIFWLIMILWLIFTFVFGWPENTSNWRGFGSLGGGLLVFCLFFLVGWQLFGFIIKDGDSPK